MIPFAILGVAPAVAASALVSPPLDQPMRVTTVEVRDDGGPVRRYQVERTLRFAPEPGGFRVAMTLDRAGGDGDVRGEMFAAANAALIGRTIVLHLGPDGQIRSIDDLDAVWARWIGGVSKGIGPERGTQAPVVALLAGLRAKPTDERLAIIGAPVSALFAPAGDRSPSPSRPTRLSLGGQTATGTTEIAREATGLRVRTRVQSAAADANALTVAIDRLIDPKTGLVREARRSERRVAGGRALTTEVTTKLVIG